jgi:two-component system, OmpR family, sensor kinase
MAEAEVLASHRKERPGSWTEFKQLSDRTPLRTKLITAALALVVMALAAICIATTYMLRSYVTTRQDGDLRAIFAQYQQSDPPHNAYPGYASPTFSNLVVMLQHPGSQVSWEPGGNLNLPFRGSPDPLPQLPTSGNWANNPVMLTVPAQSGPNTWRIIAATNTYTVTNFYTETTQQETLTFVVGVDLGNVNALIHRLILFDLSVGGAIVVVLAAVGAAVVRANLRPLNDIELTAGQIARGHLDHRIPERDSRTEIGSLGRSLNIMLSQIETAFHAQHESERAAHASEERMRRFVADASHELRTPLTTIRGFAEYYRQRGGVRKDQDPSSRTNDGASAPANGHSPRGLSPEELDHLMRRLESEASRMGLLVEDLLQLARLDQQRPLDIAPVDLLSLTADAVSDARIVAPDRRIDLIVAPGAAFIVDGDEPRLRQVIGNLVNNALTHTPPGTPMRVRIASDTLIPPVSSGHAADPNARSIGRPMSAVVLDVEDDGPGMTPEQAQRVFERFYRADQARNRASGGTGLGLAIVAGLVAAHGGTVSVRTAPGRGADFQVKLPLSPDAQGDDPEGEDAGASVF